MHIALQDKRHKRVEQVQLLQDTAGVVMLLQPALHRLQGNGTLTVLLGVIEVIAILLAIGSAISELRGKEHGSNRVDLSNLYLAIVLFVEYGLGVAAGRKRFSPLLLTAITAVFMAFFRSFLQRKLAGRALLIDDDGLNARINKFRRFKFRWSELSAIDDTRDVLRMHLHDGRVYQLPLNRYANRDEIRAAILSYAGRHVAIGS